MLPSIPSIPYCFLLLESSLPLIIFLIAPCFIVVHLPLIVQPVWNIVCEEILLKDYLI